MKAYIFTFGVGHQYGRSAVRIEAPDYYAARAKMTREFGLDWGFQYEEDEYYKEWEKAGIRPYPIKFEFTAKKVSEEIRS